MVCRARGAAGTGLSGAAVAYSDRIPLPLAPVPALGGEFEAALGGWVRQTRPPAPLNAVALDGKTVRGAAADGATAPHLLSFSTHETRETLLQVRVARKTNEIPVARAVLPLLALRGCVLTADALHTQSETTRLIVDQGAPYLFALKENHPTLYGDVAFYFADPRATWTEVCTLDRRRGRDEERRVRCAPARQASRDRTCAHLRQVLHRHTRVVERRTGRVRTTDTYYITNCPVDAYPPATLLDLLRGHWSIETRHGIRDVLFEEDAAPLRRGNVPHLMATLRSLVCTLLSRTGQTEIASARRAFARDPQSALALLLPAPQARSYLHAA